VDKNKVIKAILITLIALIILTLGYFGYVKYSQLNESLISEKTNVEVKLVENTALTTKISQLESIIDQYKKKELDANLNKVKSGSVKFSFGFPSDVRPAFRVCFTNIADKSIQHCYWKKNTTDTNSYSKDLSGTTSDTVSLPIGKYNLDFTSYTMSSLDGTSEIEVVSQSYFLNECVYYSNGSGDNTTIRDTSCESVENKLKLYPSGIYLPYHLVNNDGGKSITIEIKENKTVTLKTISLIPYLDLN
jgi:cell division protein FtsB